jgi:myosin heavy subunit
MDESNLEPADDMVTLGDLHEAALLHNVRLRFYNDDIFTYIGPILCAANPYKMIPMFTGEYVSVRRLCFRLWVLRARLETHLRCAARSRQKYFESPVGTVLPPHVYGLANNALVGMIRDGNNQSVVIRSAASTRSSGAWMPPADKPLRVAVESPAPARPRRRNSPCSS